MSQTYTINLRGHAVVGQVNSVSLKLVGDGGYARVSAQPSNRTFRVDPGGGCKVAMVTREGQDTRIYYDQWNPSAPGSPAPALEVLAPGKTTQQVCASL